MDQNQSEVLVQFLEKENKKTDDFHLKKISETDDLRVLGKYLSHRTCYSSVVREKADKRLEKDMQRMLKKINEVKLLVDLYLDTFSDVLQPYFKSYCNKITARMNVLYRQNTSVDKLMIEAGMYFVNMPDKKRNILVPIQKRIVQLVKIDKRKKSFIFLLKVWKIFPKSSPYCEELSKLMPAALMSEHSLHRLHGWYKSSDKKLTTFNYWNHNDNGASRAVLARLRKVLFDLILKAKNYKELERYYWYAHSYLFYSGDQLKKQAEESLDSSFVRILKEDKKSAHTTFVKVLNMYSKRIGSFPSGHNLYFRFKKTHFYVSSLLDEKIVAFLNSSKDAKVLYSHIKELHANYFLPQKKLAIKKLVTLAQENYRKNILDLKTIWKWCKEFDGSTNELKDFIVGLVVQEENPQNLFLFDITNLDGWDRQRVPFGNELYAIAQNRFKELLNSLKKSEPWFEECIAKEKFFGIKETFIVKAKEFYYEEQKNK